MKRTIKRKHKKRVRLGIEHDRRALKTVGPQQRLNRILFEVSGILAERLDLDTLTAQERQTIEKLQSARAEFNSLRTAHKAGDKALEAGEFVAEKAEGGW